jgi:hypothetical protein
MSQPKPTLTDAELTAIAREVLRSRYLPGEFSNSLFTVHQWVRAAEYALCAIAPDFDDLRHFLIEDERADDGIDYGSDDWACHLADMRRDDALLSGGAA